MKQQNKQAYHFSVLGVVLFYLLISLSNIFLLPNLSDLNTSRSQVDKQTSLNLVTKGAELGRQFKCVLEERKKAPALSQVSLILNSFIVLGIFVLLYNYATTLLPNSRKVHPHIPIHISLRVFRI